MLKLVGLCITFLFALGATTAQTQFAKYRKIEAYEVRPGILMMPRYAADDAVCEIGLERLHYSPEIVRLDSTLSRKEIDQILDELVPAEERGKPSKNEVGTLITQAGQSLTTTLDFENVSVQIYGATLPQAHRGETTVDEIVATVRWKRRPCR